MAAPVPGTSGCTGDIAANKNRSYTSSQGIYILVRRNKQ